MDFSEVVIGLMITEKGSFLREQSIYALKVSPRSNKILVKQAVEKLFSVKVEHVRIVNQKPKRKRSMFRRGQVGVTSSFKKAYVKLAAGTKISALEV